MEYGKRYEITLLNDVATVGEYIQTKGNDETFPTFRLDNGELWGTSIDRVGKEVE